MVVLHVSPICDSSPKQSAPKTPIYRAELEERLTSDLRDLRTTLGNDDRGPCQWHPTMILILDEGVVDSPD
jgi:hypothetical protein